MVFIVSTKEEAERLVRSGLNFGLARKSVVYFWEADPRAICYKCCGIGHDKPDACGDRLLICVICGRDHDTDDHKCNVMTCKAQKGRRCLHDSVKCGNCTSMGWENKHQASSSTCRWRKTAISTLARRRFEKGKEAAVSAFKGVIILRNDPQQPARHPGSRKRREYQSAGAQCRRRRQHGGGRSR